MPRQSQGKGDEGLEHGERSTTGGEPQQRQEEHWTPIPDTDHPSVKKRGSLTGGQEQVSRSRASRSPQQVGQLGDVSRNAPRLVAGREMHR
jgi:hypothetical protein